MDRYMLKLACDVEIYVQAEQLYTKFTFQVYAVLVAILSGILTVSSQEKKSSTGASRLRLGCTIRIRG